MAAPARDCAQVFLDFLLRTTAQVRLPVGEEECRSYYHEVGDIARDMLQELVDAGVLCALTATYDPREPGRDANWHIKSATYTPEAAGQEWWALGARIAAVLQKFLHDYEIECGEGLDKKMISLCKQLNALNVNLHFTHTPVRDKKQYFCKHTVVFSNL